MQKHGNSEKADYLQIGGRNINIYSNNKGLCLGAGILTIGEGGRLVVLRLNVPVNNFSVMSGRSHRFLGN